MMSPHRLAANGPTRGLLAHDAPPAGGATLEEVIVAAVAGAVLIAAIGAVVFAYRRGRLDALDRVAEWAARVGRMPPWAALPMGVAGVSLIIAVFGFYWDVGTHIDHGRDEGPFANPAHWWILVGLLGLALGGILSVLLGSRDRRPGAVELRDGWHVPVGGLILLLCAVIAVAGFPIDDVWHRIFGQDVTLWSPPHIQMVAGASLCTLALWMMHAEVEREAPHRRERWRFRLGDAALAGAVLIGMSTLQGEFDYGVPQFRLLFQPLLIVVAAGFALVPARLRLGPGGAFIAVGFFLAIRAAITLIVTGAFDHVTFHLPLYLGAALAVEIAARVLREERQLTVGAWAGLGVALIGLPVEWLWAQIWMPVPWTTALFPEIVYVGVPAAVAAGVVGGFIARALAPPDVPAQPVPSWVAPAAAVVLIAALVYPLPTSGLDSEVRMTLEEADVGPDRFVHATFELEEPVEDVEWFMVLAWQGAEWWSEERSIVDHLEQVDETTFRTTRPIPVHGEWKAMLRLHDDRVLAGVPIYLPEDLGIPAEEVPAEPEMTRDFVADRELLLREARDVPAWVEAVAYGAMALIALLWVSAFIWGFRRLRLTRPERAGTRT